MEVKIMKKRIYWIDFLKGWTIFLVVFGHVVNGLLYSNNYKGNSLYLLQVMKYTVYNFHMPLFFMLSGFLYYYKSNHSIKSIISNVKKNIVTLLLPYLFFSIILFIMKFIGGGAVREPLSIKDLLSIPITPVEYLWYIYILFFIYLLVECLDFLFKNNLLVLFIFLILEISSCFFSTGIFAIDRTMMMAFYFYLGKVIHEYNVKINIISRLYWVVPIYILIFVLGLISDLNMINHQIVFLTSVTGSITMIFLANKYFTSNTFFSYFSAIGAKTMAIYLVHSPIASVVRIVLFKLSLKNLTINFILGLSITWLASLIISNLSPKIKLLDFLFYPSKYIKMK
jgi:fucose 4-O-acetylase-like acetyltransferase